MIPASDWHERIAKVRRRMDEALARAGRASGSATLVAVSKTFPAEVVAQAVRAGLGTLGENRIQEAAGKIPEVARLLEGTGAPEPMWHLVGHLQSNKAREAAALFDLIHSVDDVALAERLDREAAASGHALGELDPADEVTSRRLAVLIQVNVSGESAKSGVSPEDLRPLVDAITASKRLELRGLMTIPPHETDPQRSRPHFVALRELGEQIRRWLTPSPYAGELSMGMSEDFEVALEEGATIVRVGRALFGDRDPGEP